MTEKVSTIVFTVDPDCCRCYKKLKKTLYKLQDREKIQSIAYDEKKNSVTVKGPFDRVRLIRKVCCKGCKLIKDIQIIEEKPDEKKKKEQEEKKKKEQEKKKTPPDPVCCSRPWFVPYYGGCRCCSCGWVYGPVSFGPSVFYDAPCYEEYPSCRIM